MSKRKIKTEGFLIAISTNLQFSKTHSTQLQLKPVICWIFKRVEQEKSTYAVNGEANCE